MPKYKVYGTQKIAGYVTVEAKNEREALKVAWEQGEFDETFHYDDASFESAEKVK